MSASNVNDEYHREQGKRDIHGSWIERTTGKYTMPILIGIIFLFTLIGFIVLILCLKDRLPCQVYSIFSALLGGQVGFFIGKKSKKI